MTFSFLKISCNRFFFFPGIPASCFEGFGGVVVNKNPNPYFIGIMIQNPIHSRYDSQKIGLIRNPINWDGDNDNQNPTFRKTEFKFFSEEVDKEGWRQTGTVCQWTYWCQLQRDSSPLKIM